MDSSSFMICGVWRAGRNVRASRLISFRRPAILIAGRNFGSGSSREAAVYALVDAGFKAVVAPSFGDIFASNAVNNGLLPALISEADLERLTGELNEGCGPAHIHLEHGHIIVGGSEVPFSLDNSWRTKLINGWDDIDLTLQHELRSRNTSKIAEQLLPGFGPTRKTRTLK
jgi:3-isopropylmalate/(R)-2-methylmalate dehydratase small subunit